MDKTHHGLSITGEKGGTRAMAYMNPLLQRGHKKTVKAGRHVTGVYATNSAKLSHQCIYLIQELRLQPTTMYN
jgi:hypothetical protein